MKWQDLMYEESTWERGYNLPDGIQDWDKSMEAYWSRRKRKLEEDKMKESKKDKPKKKDVSIQLPYSC